VRRMTRQEAEAIYDAGKETVVRVLLELSGKVDQLTADFAALRADCQTLRDRVQTLEEQLAQDSHNSHQPPSSDGLAKPQPKSLRPRASGPPAASRDIRATRYAGSRSPTARCGMRSSVAPTAAGHWASRRPIGWNAAKSSICPNPGWKSPSIRPRSRPAPAAASTAPPSRPRPRPRAVRATRPERGRVSGRVPTAALRPARRDHARPLRLRALQRGHARQLQGRLLPAAGAVEAAIRDLATAAPVAASTKPACAPPARCTGCTPSRRGC